jgi:hypothetical protein
MSRKEVELNHETYQVLQNEFSFIGCRFALQWARQFAAQ